MSSTQSTTNGSAAVAAKGAADVKSLLGSWLIGTLGAAIFFGIMSVQSVTYFTSFPRDNHWLKRLVAVVLIVSTLQVGFSIGGTWVWLIEDFGTWGSAHPPDVPWVVQFEPLAAQLAVFLAQLFFVYRIFLLTRRYLPLLIVLLVTMLGALALVVAITINLVKTPDAIDYSKRLSIAALSTTIFTDLVITVVTTWKLLASKNGFNASTDSGIKKLLRVTWEAATPPALMALANIIIFLTLSDRNVLFAIFNIMVPRLYVFSLLFTLNSRHAIRNVFDGSVEMSNTDPSSSNTDGSPQLRNKRKVTKIVFASAGTGDSNAGTHMTNVSFGVGDHQDTAEMDQDDKVKDLEAWGERDGTSDIVTLKTMDEEKK